MLICLHRKKEIAEIPKKIASRPRLIVNLDRKVPRERKAKAGARGSGEAALASASPLAPRARPGRALPRAPPLLPPRVPHPVISTVQFTEPFPGESCSLVPGLGFNT